MFLVFLDICMQIYKAQPKIVKENLLPVEITEEIDERDERIILNSLEILIFMVLGFVLFRISTLHVYQSSEAFYNRLTALIIYECLFIAAFIVMLYNNFNVSYNLKNI